MEAFAVAHRLGATGIETDAWRTADNEVVLDHDGFVRRRLILRRPLANLAQSELPGHIPTLREYYESFGSSLPLSVDVKDPAVFEPLLDLARWFEAADSLWVCHHDLELLEQWRRAAPEVHLVNSIRLDKVGGGLERRAADLARARVDAVNSRHRHWKGGLTTLFHRFGVLAFGWDAQHHREIRELVDIGIDAVYGDHVDRLVDVINEFY